MEISELISVIIPVYNVEKYIDRCIKSVVSQTYKNLQIILVDDGSTDNSGIICDEWKEKDNRIEVIHKTNGGLSDARNQGLKYAKGEYITLIDSDDYVDIDYVTYLFGLVKRDNCDISISSYYVNRINGNEDFGKGHDDAVLSPSEAISRMLCDDGFTVSACAKLYKKSLFDMIIYPVGKLCEDNGTTYKLFMNSEKISYGYESHYYYCVRPDSIMTSSFSWKKLDLVELTDQMAKDVLIDYPELRDDVIRRQLYARMSVLRQAAEDQTINMKDIRLEELRKYIIDNKVEFSRNRKITKRDKLGYYCLLFGNNIFRKSWNIYKKLLNNRK